jgi:hypothetical protein
MKIEQSHGEPPMEFESSLEEKAYNENLENVGRRATNDAEDYMQDFRFKNNGGREIPAGFDVKSDVIRGKIFSLNAELMQHDETLSAEMIQEYEEVFRRQCSLGYPIKIH